MMRPIKRLEVAMDELESIIERAKTTPLTDEDCAKLRKAFETLFYLTNLVGEKDTTISKLRKILFGAGTETIRNVLAKQDDDSASDLAAGSGKTEETAKPKAKGHGRKGADAARCLRPRLPRRSGC